MQTIHVILFCLVIILSLLVMTLVGDEPASSYGLSHGEISQMRVGGDGAARLEKLSFIPFTLQIFTLSLVISLIYLGFSQGAGARHGLVHLGAIWLVMVTVWYFLYASYESYLAGETVSYFFGFPEPTAWMLFGVWSSAALLALFYAIGFRKYILTHEDERRFHEIVRTYKSGKGD